MKESQFLFYKMTLNLDFKMLIRRDPSYCFGCSHPQHRRHVSIQYALNISVLGLGRLEDKHGGESVTGKSQSSRIWVERVTGQRAGVARAGEPRPGMLARSCHWPCFLHRACSPYPVVASRSAGPGAQGLPASGPEICPRVPLQGHSQPWPDLASLQNLYLSKDTCDHHSCLVLVLLSCLTAQRKCQGNLPYFLKKYGFIF